MAGVVPPNNPLKLPFFLFCAAVGVVLAALGVANSSWGLAVVGALLIAGCVPPIAAIRKGRNPWWIRAPLDRRWGRRRG
jgi:hypothetical protein